MSRFSEELAQALTPVGLYRRSESVVPPPRAVEQAEAERLAPIVEQLLRRDPSLLRDLGWASVTLPVEVRREAAPWQVRGDGLELYLPPGILSVETHGQAR